MYFRLHKPFSPPERVGASHMLYQLLKAAIPTAGVDKGGSKMSCIRRQHVRRWQEIKVPASSSSREAGHFISDNALLVIATSWSHCCPGCSWDIAGLPCTPLKRESSVAQFTIICTQENASQMVIIAHNLEDIQKLQKVQCRRKLLNEWAAEGWKRTWFFSFFTP